MNYLLLKKNDQLNLFLYKKYNDDVINNIELNWCKDATKILAPDKTVRIPNKIFYLFKAVSILGLIIFLQIILGIFTVLTGASIFVASLHQFSSILLITSSLYFMFKNRFS